MWCKLTCEGTRTTEVRAQVSPRGSGRSRERDSIAQSWGLGGKEAGNNLAFLFICLFLINFPSLISGFDYFGFCLTPQGISP